MGMWDALAFTADEDEAIPTFADTAGAMSERFGSMPSPHRTGNVQTMPPPTEQPTQQLRAPDPEVGGLLVRDQPKLTAPAGPDFSMADRGPEFDPPTQAKIAAMMRLFSQQPHLVDEVIRLIQGEAAIAQEITPE